MKETTTDAQKIRIQSLSQREGIYEDNKILLSSFDNKRYIRDDGTQFYHMYIKILMFIKYFD